ncbi:MAG: aminotransferase class III-fold pyridoxal phosphate-dependent enzyme [Treponemataceae bacterium]|nr:aminotransferase class III-fold pyridoxal phosphate-dependent enzyme [Treponemataceae bacterium]
MADKTKIANNFGSFDLTFAKGKGATMTDVNGKKYIDFVSGIGVNCLGHNHKKLAKAVAKQAAKQIHISNYYTSDIQLEFVENLLRETGFDKVYFGNSGAEANEAAFKLARKYGWLVQTGAMADCCGVMRKSETKRNVIVTLKKSFHGRTVTTLKATGQDKFHPDCFAPYPEGFKYLTANSYEELETMFDDTVCALMIECVQGEGGVNLIDADWAKAAATAARNAGAMVIADEVQTGMGRTGTLLASDPLGFMPEAVSLAKGIAGGVPMGACLYRGTAKDVFVAGDHQSTFAGNPLACAAGNVVINELTKPGFLAEVREKGEYIRNAVKGWNLACITDVRGKGLMIGIDISEDVGTAGAIQKACLAEGLCITTAGVQTLRFLPPLVITMKEIDAGLETLHQILEKGTHV